MTECIESPTAGVIAAIIRAAGARVRVPLSRASQDRGGSRASQDRAESADHHEVRPLLRSPLLAVAPPARGEHERSAVRLGLRAVLPPRGRTDGAAALTRAQRDRSRDESADHDERLRCAIERCRRAPPAECHEQVTRASPGCARGLRLYFTRARVLRALRATRQARVRPAVVPGHHALSELCPATELSSIAIDRYRSPSIAIDIYMRRERAKRKPLQNSS